MSLPYSPAVSVPFPALGAPLSCRARRYRRANGGICKGNFIRTPALL
jgi:hypothetical protein